MKAQPDNFGIGNPAIHIFHGVIFYLFWNLVNSPTGLGFFRHGNYIKYEGDNFDDEEIIDWLTDPNVMEVSDQIEKVNKRMLQKLMSRNDYLAVVFSE